MSSIHRQRVVIDSSSEEEVEETENISTSIMAPEIESDSEEIVNETSEVFVEDSIVDDSMHSARSHQSEISFITSTPKSNKSTVSQSTYGSFHSNPNLHDRSRSFNDEENLDSENQPLLTPISKNE
ncbi:hypothetical protein GCK72_003045 [Caenorhabditis remanei]|uniref:Uncharacterized protein n=1 Tax=Caenorhabditis remanei TaxID=31234 RepID=A0A6A5HU08_CAERE|nr:hypothetical protein GCK72_003045 [Caenorhabditis remanei]KAF1771219.1 hypothetical protein GCK72_003045 [Caenorhabditis remanei]